MENPKGYSEPWNFGPGNEGVKTVGNLVEEVLKQWGNGEWLKPETSNMPHEAGLLTLDITKAKSNLKWEPALSFSQSIKYTIDWYRAQAKGENMFEFSKNQISEYQKLLKWK
jgi:CDP-glucose 4,6-dehydratase